MSLSLNFPVINPSLMIDFVNRTSLDSRVTFTRGSSATFFDSSGVITTAAANVPRFDYNPSTLAPLGLLIEEQRTNSLTYSEDFANAAWTKTNSSITANTIVAPDGALTGDKLVENTSTGNHLTQHTSTSVSGLPYTLSVYGKAAERSQIRMALSGTEFSSGRQALFSLSTGVVTAVDANVTAVITAVGNGWFRCSITATATSSGSNPITIQLGNGATTANPQSYTGDGYSGVFIWGAQLEAGAFPTSYIPTTTTALTRNADVASMTGTNFSSWYNQSAGTFLTIYSLARPSSGSNQFTCRASDNGYNNAVAMNNNSTGFPAIATASGGVFDGIASAVSALTANVVAKVAGCYATNDLAISLNGAAVVTDTSATIPTGLTRFDIGSDHAGVNRIQGGYIQRIAYYPVRLASSQLQALTA